MACRIQTAGRACDWAASLTWPSEISAQPAPNNRRCSHTHSRSPATPVAPQRKRVPHRHCSGGIERFRSPSVSGLRSPAPPACSSEITMANDNYYRARHHEAASKFLRQTFSRAGFSSRKPPPNSTLTVAGCGLSTTGRWSIALMPGRLRHRTSDSSTASVNSGQRRNRDFSAHRPSMRASWWPRQK
jgi:hypothetical protein